MDKFSKEMRCAIISRKGKCRIPAYMTQQDFSDWFRDDLGRLNLDSTLSEVSLIAPISVPESPLEA